MTNNDYSANGLHKFIKFKKKCYLKLSCCDSQIKQYLLFQRKIKILSNQTTTEMVQNFINNFRFSIDWKKVYENNYFSSIETKLRSF